MDSEYIPGIDGVRIELPLFGDSFRISDNSLVGYCRSPKEFENMSCSRVSELEEFHQCLDSKNYKQVTLVKYKGIASQKNELKALVHEVGMLKKLEHPNILKFLEPAVYHLSNVHLVFEPFPCFISDVIRYEVVELYNPAMVKSVMSQLLTGLNYLHEHSIMHRNIHPNNLAIASNGELKICNFRNACHLWEKYLKVEVDEFRYQSLEMLMELSLCSTPADIWSAACIFVELLSEKSFFNGKSTSCVMSEIFTIFGFPSKQVWPDFYEFPLATFLSEELCNLHQTNFLRFHFKKQMRPDEDTMDLLQSMFCLDPSERAKASECLTFRFFKNEPKACKNEELKKCIGTTLTRRKTHLEKKN